MSKYNTTFQNAPVTCFVPVKSAKNPEEKKEENKEEKEGGKGNDK